LYCHQIRISIKLCEYICGGRPVYQFNVPCGSFCKYCLWFQHERSGGKTVTTLGSSFSAVTN